MLEYHRQHHGCICLEFVAFAWLGRGAIQPFEAQVPDVDLSAGPSRCASAMPKTKKGVQRRLGGWARAQSAQVNYNLAAAWSCGVGRSGPVLCPTVPSKTLERSRRSKWQP